MEIKDLNITASLLCQEGVKLKGWKIRKSADGRVIFYFQLGGKEEKELNEMFLAFFKNELIIKPQVFQIRNILLDIIKQYAGIKAEHQLPYGEVIGEVVDGEKLNKIKQQEEINISSDERINKEIERIRKGRRDGEKEI